MMESSRSRRLLQIHGGDELTSSGKHNRIGHRHALAISLQSALQAGAIVEQPLLHVFSTTRERLSKRTEPNTSSRKHPTTASLSMLNFGRLTGCEWRHLHPNSRRLRCHLEILRNRCLKHGINGITNTHKRRWYRQVTNIVQVGCRRIQAHVQR